MSFHRCLVLLRTLFGTPARPAGGAPAQQFCGPVQRDERMHWYV